MCYNLRPANDYFIFLFHCPIVVAIISNGVLYITWLGDSKCIICSSDGNVRSLTSDHRASEPEEAKRISAQGGVVAKGRTFGSLQLSRSFGDPSLKEATLLRHLEAEYNELLFLLLPEGRRDSFFKDKEAEIKSNNGAVAYDAVSNESGYMELRLDSNDELLLIGSDGFWDVTSPSSAINACRRYIREGMSISDVCKHMVFDARKRGSSDDITVYLVNLLRR